RSGGPFYRRFRSALVVERRGVGAHFVAIHRAVLVEVVAHSGTSLSFIGVRHVEVGGINALKGLAIVVPQAGQGNAAGPCCARDDALAVGAWARFDRGIRTLAPIFSVDVEVHHPTVCAVGWCWISGAADDQPAAILNDDAAGPDVDPGA